MKTRKALGWSVWLVAGAIIIIAIVSAIWRHERRFEPANALTAKRSDRVAFVQPLTSPNTSMTRMASMPVTALGPQERALDLPALREALAGRSDAQAEEHRIVAFARFRDLVAAYSGDRARMSALDRARVARRILAELPEHVARNEIVPVQAEALTAVLLNDAEPDPLARSAALSASHEQWDAYAKQTVGPSPEQDPRYRAYVQRSRIIFQEVQATIPDPVQQQTVIAQRLQALRAELFDERASTGMH